MKSRKYLLLYILIALMLFSSSCGSESQPDTKLDASAKKITQVKKETHPYTNIIGNGMDSVNIFIYFYGTDLEDVTHMASQDIKEIQQNYISDKVNIIIETNGAKNWDADVINASNEYVQRFKITESGEEILHKNLGPVNFDVEESLEWFIADIANNYPYDRNILILWGHGNGTDFWGDDALLPGGISIETLDNILTKYNVKFETIGFDACAMANLSTIYTMSKHADYLVASSKDEPIEGWNYQNWISLLSENTSIPAEVYLKQIVNDYTKNQNTDLIVDMGVFDLNQVQSFVNYIHSIVNSPDCDIKLNEADDNRKGVPVSEVIKQLNILDINALNNQLNKLCPIYQSNDKEYSQIDGLNITAKCTQLLTYK